MKVIINGFADAVSMHQACEKEPRSGTEHKNNMTCKQPTSSTLNIVPSSSAHIIDAVSNQTQVIN